jgi:hypothetical protein
MPTVSGKRSWQLKAQVCAAYWQSGLYQKRYKTNSCRILTFTTGPTRLENLKHITEAAGGGSMFYFTTFEQATREAILKGPIWRVAGSAELHPLVW